MTNWQMKKIHNITNHQRTTNQNHNEYHLTPVRRILSKRLQMANVSEDVEKREP